MTPKPERNQRYREFCDNRGLILEVRAERESYFSISVLLKFGEVMPQETLLKKDALGIGESIIMALAGSGQAVAQSILPAAPIFFLLLAGFAVKRR